MADVTQQYIDNLITFINNAEDPGTVTNQILAAVLDYLNNGIKKEVSLQTAINGLQQAINQLGGNITGNSETTTRTYASDALTAGKVYKPENISESNPVTANAWRYGIFQVKPGDVITLTTDGNGDTFPALIFYNGDTYISHIAQNAYGELDTITNAVAPAGTTQIAVNCYRDNVSSFSLVISRTTTTVGLNQRVSTLESDVDTLQAGMGDVQDDVSALGSAVDDMQQDMAQIGGLTTTQYTSDALTYGKCIYPRDLSEDNPSTVGSSWYHGVFQVRPGDVITLTTDGNGDSVPPLLAFNGDTYVNHITGNNYNVVDDEITYTVPAGVTQIAVNCYRGQISNFALSIVHETGIVGRVSALEKTADELTSKVEVLEENAGGSDNTGKEIMEQRNVVFLGSSNVWGDGFLFYSYLNAPIKWLYKSTGTFNGIDDITIESDNDVQTLTNTAKFFDGKAKKITGVGSAITFRHKGSELNICQVVERTTDFALIGVYDGSTKVAEFTNHNDTVGGVVTETFVGDGTTRKFNLSRCFTYGHMLTVDGLTKTVVMNTGGYGATIPSSADAMVIRTTNTSMDAVVHALWFASAPKTGALISVSYYYGETICFVKSTVGEDAAGTNESPYGDGRISYDILNPSSIGSGLDFRIVNEKAFYRLWFDTDEERTITLKIEGGTNPYFDFNFASSTFHNVMNAGIGGYTASYFNDVANHPLTSYPNIAKYFTPDFVSIGLTGNDDWANFPRKISRVVNMTLAELRDFPSLEIGAIAYQSGDDTYNVTVNTGIISAATLTSLTCSQIVGSNVAVGDFARIGTYTGDLRQVQTRRITSVDTTTGTISWAEPLHLNEYLCLDSVEDLKGQEVSIRSIEQYMTNMVQLVTNIKSMAPKCKICLFNIYYVDMWARNTAEYTYIQQWIASNFDNSVFVVDAWRYARDYVELGRKTRTLSLTADGTNTLAFSSPSSLGHWEGIEVWVNGRNVYGKDCYVRTGYYYTVNQSATGSALNWAGSTDYLKPATKNTSMKLIWRQNVPSNGTAVTVKLVTHQWSNDWAHPRDGEFIYNSLGRAMIYALDK